MGRGPAAVDDTGETPMKYKTLALLALIVTVLGGCCTAGG